MDYSRISGSHPILSLISYHFWACLFSSSSRSTCSSQVYLAASFLCSFIHDLLLTWRRLPSSICPAHSNSSFKPHLDLISSMKSFHGNPDRTLELWLVPQHQNPFYDMIVKLTKWAILSIWLIFWEQRHGWLHEKRLVSYSEKSFQVQLERENNDFQHSFGNLGVCHGMKGRYSAAWK